MRGENLGGGVPGRLLEPDLQSEKLDGPIIPVNLAGSGGRDNAVVASTEGGRWTSEYNTTSSQRVVWEFLTKILNFVQHDPFRTWTRLHKLRSITIQPQDSPFALLQWFMTYNPSVWDEDPCTMSSFTTLVEEVSLICTFLRRSLSSPNVHQVFMLQAKYQLFQITTASQEAHSCRREREAMLNPERYVSSR